MKARVSSGQDTVSQLTAQLDEFIKTKNETEAAMLQQFMQLLNEKKRKIRDQSRLLASAKVDKDAGKFSRIGSGCVLILLASAIQAARAETKPRKAAASRASKRKAPVAVAKPEPESDTDQMEIDEAKAEEQDESSLGAVTPDRTSDEETQDEDNAPSTNLVSRPQSTTAPSEVSMQDAGPPPPRRELPFSRPATRSKPAARKVSPPEDEDTEDEEL